MKIFSKYTSYIHNILIDFKMSNTNDFGEMMDGINSYAKAFAVETIKSGEPNKYIGNPGIINELQQTPLTVLAGRDASEVIGWALKNGCDPNMPRYWAVNWKDKSPENGTSLKYPIEQSLGYRDMKSVKLMLEYGADLEKINLNHAMWNMIISAQSYNKEEDESFLETLKFLLDHGANPEAVISSETNRDLLTQRWKGNLLKNALEYMDKYNIYPEKKTV